MKPVTSIGLSLVAGLVCRIALDLAKNPAIDPATGGVFAFMATAIILSLDAASREGTLRLARGIGGHSYLVPAQSYRALL